jgi:hypothetical protein
MPEIENTLTSPAATPTPSSTLPGTTAGVPTTPVAADWRAPAGTKFAGMTAEQVLGIAQTATDMLQTNVAPPQPPAAPAPAAHDVGDDEYMTGRDFRRALEAQRATPDMTAVTLAADANLSIVRGQFAQDFGRYGGEINALIDRVPANLRTIDNLRRCVNMVRSDHVDEIAAERAAQLAATIAPTLRPTGGGSAPAAVSREHSLESEKIPDAWKARARAANITEGTVSEFCRANGMSEADFYKQFDTSPNAIVGDVSQRRMA